MKRKLALFLVLVMVFTSVNSMTLAVHAADAVETIASESEFLTETAEETAVKIVGETDAVSEQIPETEVQESEETENTEESKGPESEGVKESETQTETKETIADETIVEETVMEEETQDNFSESQ